MTLRFDGHCDLPCQQSNEFNIKLIVGAGFVTPEIKYSQSVIGGRQWKAADCLDRMIWYRLRKRKAIFQSYIVNDYRLLVLPDPASDRPIHPAHFWLFTLCA